MEKKICLICKTEMPLNWDIKICPRCEKEKCDYDSEQAFIIQEMIKNENRDTTTRIIK